MELKDQEKEVVAGEVIVVGVVGPVIVKEAARNGKSRRNIFSIIYFNVCREE